MEKAVPNWHNTKKPSRFFIFLITSETIKLPIAMPLMNAMNIMLNE
jgi:hypothetical protein